MKKIPEDYVKEIMFVATVLRQGGHPHAVCAPDGTDRACGQWLAEVLERLAEGRTAAAALGINPSRPKLTNIELLRSHNGYLRARIVDGLAHNLALAEVPGVSAAVVAKHITEARKRGIVRKLTAADLKRLRALRTRKKR